MDIKFSVIIHPISNNDLYMPRPCKGGKSAYITKSSANKRFEDKIDPLLAIAIPDDTVSELREELKDCRQMMELTLDVYMPKTNFYTNDASSYLKATEDSIKWRIQIDDCRNKRVIIEKFISDNEDWHIECRLRTILVDELTEDRWNNTVKGTT